MKKLFFILVVTLITFLLCSCSEKTTSGYTEVSNPFETSIAEESTDENTQIDERYELYGKYQTGGASTDFSEMGDSTVIEYNGEEVEIIFSLTTNDNKRTITEGFMLYLGGVPQMISANGGEKAEFVAVPFPDNEKTRVSIKFAPVITKDMENEKELPLQLVTMHSVDYIPQKKYLGFSFGNIHYGSTFLSRKLKLNKTPQVTDNFTYTESDYITASDKSIQSYPLNNAGEIHTGSYLLKMFSDGNKTDRLILDGNTLNCDVVFDGMYFDNYRIYFYKNHQRISVNGKDYATVNAKSGFVPILNAKLENINNHDIIYAIAVPRAEDYLKASIAKSGSKVAFSPDDSIITGEAPNTPEQTTKPTESTPVQEDMDENKLYSYTPMGYIDDEMNYLLLYKGSIGDYEIVVYNEQEKCFSAPITEYDTSEPIISYGDGIFTLLKYRFSKQDSNDEDYLAYVINYDKECREIGRIELPYYPNNDYGIKYVLSAAYHKKSERYVVCYQDNESDERIISFFDKNGNEEKFLNVDNYTGGQIYAEDDRIIIRKQKLHPMEDTLLVVDLKGNTLYEKTIGNEYNAIHTERAGKYIYMLPSQRTDFRNKPLPTGEVAVYDTERDELFLLRPKTAKEAALIRFTPNGRYAVAVNVEDITNENLTEYLGSINTVRIYDIATGEVIKEFTEEKPFWFTTLVVYNDGFIVRDVNTVRYEYKFDFE